MHRTKLIEEAAKHSSEPAEYFKYLWGNLSRACKSFVVEMEQLDGKIMELEGY